VRPHQAERDIRCGIVLAKDLLNTYAGGTNTGARERSPVQSHVALHHIHQPSALSAGVLGPGLKTAFVYVKHQSACQGEQARKADSPSPPLSFSVLSLSLKRK